MSQNAHESMTASVRRNIFPEFASHADARSYLLPNTHVQELFLELPDKMKQELLDFCIGKQGLRLTYDCVFQKLFRPDLQKERLESLLSAILERTVQIISVIPREGTQLVERGSFVIMEHSPAPFHTAPDKYIHKRVSRFESGIYPDNAGLHEDIFICLDSFHKITHTITKDSTLQEAWLTFLCSTDVQTISSLIRAFPFFAEIYLEIKDFLKQPEELINMFSKELYIMDRNMEKLMIEEWQEEMQATREELDSTKEACQVYKLRLNGKSRQEIAEILEISPDKVDNILDTLI